MIRVSKEAALKLNKEYGIKFGENGLSKPHGHHKHYFLAETERNLRTLLEFDSHDEAKQLLATIEKKKEKYSKQ